MLSEIRRPAEELLACNETFNWPVMRVKVAGLVAPLLSPESDVPVGTPGAVLCVTQIGIVLEEFRFQQRLKIVGKSAFCICRGDRDLDGVAGEMDESRKLALQGDFFFGSSKTLRRRRNRRQRRDAETCHGQEP
jgi:hypothetical protein